MQLIYRGQTLEVIRGSAATQNKSHAVNWRFCVPGFMDNTTSTTPVLKRSDRQLHAINWRFRIATAD